MKRHCTLLLLSAFIAFCASMVSTTTQDERLDRPIAELGPQARQALGKNLGHMRIEKFRAWRLVRWS